MIRKVLWLYLPNSLFWINDLRSAKGNNLVSKHQFNVEERTIIHVEVILKYQSELNLLYESQGLKQGCC